MSHLNYNQVILFLSNKSSDRIMENYSAVREAESAGIDVFFLYHAQDNAVPEAIEKQRHFIFSDDVLHELGYTPLRESLLPGSNHFPLLKFYLENPQYDYYWLVEDDVYFTGDWNTFFDAFRRLKSDFVSSRIRKYEEEPYWYWWRSLRCPVAISKENLVCSFNPVYRLSHSALDCLDLFLKSAWGGHHEAVIPTVLYYRGLSLMDMGGTGSFTPRNFKNRFYIPESMWYLPIPLGDRRNTLYHPIKESVEILNAWKQGS